jgi:hypothetical protein
MIQRRDEEIGASERRVATASTAASDLVIGRDGAAADELAYTDLLFDFRSVRESW